MRILLQHSARRVRHQRRRQTRRFRRDMRRAMYRGMSGYFDAAWARDEMQSVGIGAWAWEFRWRREEA